MGAFLALMYNVPTLSWTPSFTSPTIIAPCNRDPAKAMFTLLKYPAMHFSSIPRAAMGNGQLVQMEILHESLNNVAVGTIVYAQADLSGRFYMLQ